jgi:hypothetical protein
MLTEEPKAEVSQRLEDLGKIYDEHNKLYGADYYEHGALMMALFPPHGITLTNESEFLRYNLFKQMAAKLARYANNFFKGGHKDSLDDIAVYSQMLAEIDGIIERKMKG